MLFPAVSLSKESYKHILVDGKGYADGKSRTFM